MSAAEIPTPEPALWAEGLRFGRPAPSWRAVDDVAGLAVLFEDAVSLVVLRGALARTVDPSAPWLARDRDARVVVDPEAQAFTGLLPHDAGAADEAVLDALAPLVEVFAALAECARVGVRLAVTGAAMCPRFHVDHVGLRAAVTLLGPGTEWLDHRDVDRARLGHRAGGLADDRSGLLRAGAVVHRAEAGDLVLMKGAAWPDNELRAAVHRSPRVDGARRVVVTLDALDG